MHDSIDDSAWEGKKFEMTGALSSSFHCWLVRRFRRREIDERPTRQGLSLG